MTPPRTHGDNVMPMRAPSGFPFQIALDMARLADATIFIETGTFKGETTRWASAHFDKIYTIERAVDIYNMHNRELRYLGNVNPILGDSREALGDIIPDLLGRRAVFWLDGHWSGGGTAGADDECPLLDELALISSRKDDIILIDDARLFLSSPPKPHNPLQWPTITEVIAVLMQGGRQPYVQIVGDVIFAIPNVPLLRQCLTDYAQWHAEGVWKDYLKLRSEMENRWFLSGLIQKIRSRLKFV